MKRTNTTVDWMIESYLQSVSKYREGDCIIYSKDGKEYVISEVFGENIDGIREYYIEPRGFEGNGVYVTEREICKHKSILPPISTEKVCIHPNKYLNKVSANLQFWFCPDCRQEVDPPSLVYIDEVKL